MEADNRIFTKDGDPFSLTVTVPSALFIQATTGQSFRNDTYRSFDSALAFGKPTEELKGMLRRRFS